MGGNAFRSLLGDGAFPRLPPLVYQSIKASLLPTIEKYYVHVAIPYEAPEKIDHGDIDFVVEGKKTEQMNTVHGGEIELNVPHEIIKQAVGAVHVNPMEGNRTSNFAIPIDPKYWALMGLDQKIGEESQSTTQRDQIFCQVDIHVCLDKDEWQRVVFFSSYGDLGMIMGLTARNCGLHLGLKGLRFLDPPYPHFELSQSFDDITEFLGLSMERWKAGFSTKVEAFEWVTQMKYFEPRQFHHEGIGFSKVKSERTMYGEFIQWVTQMKLDGLKQQDNGDREKRNEAIRKEALVFFGKEMQYNAMMKERYLKNELKKCFNGHKVQEWTELGGYWVGVKKVMDGVRDRAGGERGIMLILENGEEQLKRLVLEVKEDLGNTL